MSKKMTPISSMEMDCSQRMIAVQVLTRMQRIMIGLGDSELDFAVALIEEQIKGLLDLK